MTLPGAIVLRVLCAVTAVLSVESAAMPKFDAQGPNPPGAPVFDAASIKINRSGGPRTFFQPLRS